MNRKLEELFNLPPSERDGLGEGHDSQVGSDTQYNVPILPESLATLDKIESALPAVRGLESSDQEMDDLACKARESFDDLMTLGMQVDSRYASEIFAVAGTMLGHAITAKTAKINKKLKTIELQLKKARLDQDAGQADTPPIGEGRILNRNDLLKHVLSRDSENKPNDK